MPKPICVPCQRFYRVVKNGFSFIEGMPIVDGAKAGTAQPEAWKPYKLWRGDLWECLGCHTQIVVGVAGQPMAEHYEANFTVEVGIHKPTLQVNDC